VQHLLEDPLQGQVLVQPRPAGPQQLLQVVPQAKHVVLARVDALGVVVALGLQLPGDAHQHLDAFLVGVDVRLDGVVLLLRRLHRRQVVTKVILKGDEGETSCCVCVCVLTLFKNTLIVFIYKADHFFTSIFRSPISYVYCRIFLSSIKCAEYFVNNNNN